jgi:hypothetical protein
LLVLIYIPGYQSNDVMMGFSFYVLMVL